MIPAILTAKAVIHVLSEDFLTQVKISSLLAKNFSFRARNFPFRARNFSLK
jgi:hypothetical protein